MTRDELIEELKKLPNDEKVLVRFWDDGDYRDLKVDRVIAYPEPIIEATL